MKKNFFLEKKKSIILLNKEFENTTFKVIQLHFMNYVNHSKVKI